MTEQLPSPVVIQALGQAGFVLHAGRIVVAIDPYLSNSAEEAEGHEPGLFARRFPPPVQPAALGDLAAVLVTHSHGDHCDPQTLLPFAATWPKARFWGPYPVVARLREWGIASSRIVEGVVGLRSEVVPGCWVTALASAHYWFEPNARGEPAYCGYVVELGGTTLYHSGDTIRYEGLAERLRTAGICVALLPVNGRDAERERLGIVGNLGPEEAMQLAVDAGARMIVPMHNDLFASNSLPDERVLKAWQAHREVLECRFLSPGQSTSWGGPIDRT